MSTTRMRMLGVVLLLAGLSAGPTQAQESQAKSWGLSEEELARFEATVVDLACELGGDCPTECGALDRQYGLLRSDGTLVPVAKNGQPLFNGAGADLAPYCGQEVEVDGLFAGHSGFRFYQIQLIREAGADEWQKTDRWTKVWDEQHPDLAAEEGPWFRKDPRIQARIAEHGYLGLGREADQEFLEEWR
jgi:hypothetical protein